MDCLIRISPRWRVVVGAVNAELQQRRTNAQGATIWRVVERHPTIVDAICAVPEHIAMQTGIDTLTKYLKQLRLFSESTYGSENVGPPKLVIAAENVAARVNDDDLLD